MLACHNYWHWALYFMKKGDYEAALRTSSIVSAPYADGITIPCLKNERFCQSNSHMKMYANMPCMCVWVKCMLRCVHVRGMNTLFAEVCHDFFLFSCCLKIEPWTDGNPGYVLSKSFRNI
ncbi:unnamed protein product [Lota lota]